MGTKALLLSALACLLSASDAGAQAPPQDPGTFPQAHLVVDGEVRIASQVFPGETFLSFPIRHTRTGILENEISSDGRFIRRGVFAPRGSTAIWLGSFAPSRARNAEAAARDVWCFIWPDEATPSINRCARGRDIIVPAPLYEPDLDNVRLVSFEGTLSEEPFVIEGQNKPAPDIQLVYRLETWQEDELWYKMEGSLISRAPLEADGSALIQTLVGTIRLTRSADPDEAIVAAPTTDGTFSWGSLDRELTEKRAEAIEAIPYPLIAAITPSEPDADFRPIANGDVLLEQEIRPASIFRSNQRRRGGGNTMILRRGDLLAEFENSDGRVVCPINDMRQTSCYRDGDDAPGFEITYSITRTDNSLLYLKSVALSYPVDPVRIEPAPDAVPPSEVLRLTYLDVTQSQTSTYARFSWTGATNSEAAYGLRSVVALQLDESGATSLTTDAGDVIGEFRFADGQAMFRTVGGIPEHAAQVVSREGQAAEMLRTLEAAPDQ